jgi:hypothetical protein
MGLSGGENVDAGILVFRAKDGSSMFLQNNGIHPHTHMALLPTKLISTEYILFGVGPECI